MLKYLYLLAFFLSTKAFGNELRILSLESFRLEHSHVEHYRDSYFPYPDMHHDEGGEYWTRKTSAMFDVDLLTYGIYGLRWKNDVHGMSTNSQFRETGWKWRFGLQVHEMVEFFHDHHSRHLLDDVSPTGDRFPVEDFLGVSVELYRRGRN